LTVQTYFQIRIRKRSGILIENPQIHVSKKRKKGDFYYVLVAGGTPLLPISVGTPGMLLDANTVAAAACHQLLLQRYPTQTALLNMSWDFWTRLFPLPMDSSESYGRMVGNAVNLLGINDRQVGRAQTYTPGGPYTHSVAPNEPTQGYAGPAWGNAKRLVTATRVANFASPPGRTGPTTVIPNAHFAADFDKVQSKGASDDRLRTGQEEVTGIFWGYDGPPELGTPPRLYMQVVLAVLDEIEVRNPGGLTEQEELQIIAATGLAMADAGIDAWFYKYSPDHMMWRPILGIKSGDSCQHHCRFDDLSDCPTAAGEGFGLPLTRCWDG
jgi:vanadium chloroperoxidase